MLTPRDRSRTRLHYDAPRIRGSAKNTHVFPDKRHTVDFNIGLKPTPKA